MGVVGAHGVPEKSVGDFRGFETKIGLPMVAPSGFAATGSQGGVAIWRPSPLAYHSDGANLGPGQRHFRRRTISKRFRSIALACLPGLSCDPAYWQFFGYLLYGAACDEHSGKLLIGQPRLASVTGQNGNNFIAESFLRRFQRDVLSLRTFAWTGYSKFGGKCRRVSRCVWPAALAAAIPREIAKEWHSEGRYYLDGTGFSAAVQRGERLVERNSAELRPGLCPDAMEIQAYINGLEPHLFTRTVTKHYARALDIARALSNPISQTEQLRMLPGIADQPQPFYGASEEGNTVRLFACESIPNLQGDVRRALTADWVEADLKSCQLAICAAKWQVPLVLRFLESGRSVWDYFGGKLGLTPSQLRTAKPALKEALYSVCYGQLKRVVQAEVTKALKPLGIVKGGLPFVEDELIVALLEAREREMARMQAEGRATDCYGKEILVTPNREPRQILAELAQAWEMKILAPAFRMAKGKKDFKIVLYQFDGFSVHFTDKEREQAWRRKISEAVSGEAQRCGVGTGLEWEGEGGTELQLSVN